MEYIEMEKANMPYTFQISLGAELFSFVMQYNKREDLFTCHLIKDNEVLVYGEPLIYGEPLFQDVWTLDFPIVTLVPKDEAMEVGDLTYDNFNEQVFLVVDQT